MIKRIFILSLLLLVNGITLAQDSIYGKVYGKKAVAKYIKVSNVNSKLFTYSNKDGDFSIKASIGDSILFSSSFYETQKTIIDKAHFGKIFVVQLDDKINELDVVIVNSEVDFKEFNIEEYNTNLKNQIKEDMKRNPHLYGAYSNENLIIKKIISFIGRLLSKKNKETIKTITYEEFKELFQDDNFFNEELLLNELSISKQYRHLFFEFCSAKNISSVNLNKENELFLLESLISASSDFNKIIRDNEKHY